MVEEKKSDTISFAIEAEDQWTYCSNRDQNKTKHHRCGEEYSVD